MFPATPAAPQTMQPLGGPGTPASPQALPYSYFPAPQIGQASAGMPASPIAPLMQNTQAQIGDALSAARGPQPPPQLAARPAGGGMGALGMGAAAPRPPVQQQPSPWATAFGPQAQQQQGGQPTAQGAPDMNQGGGGQPSWGSMPPQLQEMFRSMSPPHFGGGFNWGGQQGGGNPGQSAAPNRTPTFDQMGMMGPGMFDRNRYDMAQPMDGARNWMAGGR